MVNNTIEQSVVLPEKVTDNTFETRTNKDMSVTKEDLK